MLKAVFEGLEGESFVVFILSGIGRVACEYLAQPQDPTRADGLVGQPNAVSRSDCLLGGMQF